MKQAFIIALSVLAASAAGIEVKAQAEAQAGATTNTPVTPTTKVQVEELADSLFQSEAGYAINFRLSPLISTEPADNPGTVYRSEIELWAAKPINLIQSNKYPGKEYSGIFVQAAKSNPLQLINPWAPTEYGNGEPNVIIHPGTKGAEGLKLFQISF